MSDETAPGPDLRERIDSAIRDWLNGMFDMGEYVGTFEPSRGTDTVMAVAQPELDQRDAEIAELRAAVAPGNVELVRRLVHSYSRLVTIERDDARKRANQAEAELAVWREDHRHAQAHLAHRLDQRLGAAVTVLALARLATEAIDEAEAERDQLKTELRRLHTLFDEAEQSLPIQQRRLLAISRMVFDHIAEGRPITRDEAADLAQRIVDEIGHSVTEEPALGPSFRVEIAELKAEVAKLHGWDESLSGRMAKDLAAAKSRAEKAEAERDQLKAANDRAKALATNATRAYCGAGWDLNPAEVLTALQPAVSKET